MTEHEQDAIVGRVVREKKEKQLKLAALQDQAGRLGGKFSQLGEMLKTNPVDVVVVNRSDSRPGTFSAEDISTSRLTELTDDIRKTTQELEELANRAKALAGCGKTQSSTNRTANGRPIGRIYD